MPSPSDTPPWHRMPLADISVNHRPDLEELDDWTLGIYYEALNKSMDYSTKLPPATSREDIIRIIAICEDWYGIAPQLNDTSDMDLIGESDESHPAPGDNSTSSPNDNSSSTDAEKIVVPRDNFPVSGFGKNWCWAMDLPSGLIRYYYARGKYYRHVQDHHPTNKDDEEQLRLSGDAKKANERSKKRKRRKQKAQNQRAKDDDEAKARAAAESARQVEEMAIGEAIDRSDQERSEEEEVARNVKRVHQQHQHRCAELISRANRCRGDGRPCPLSRMSSTDKARLCNVNLVFTTSAPLFDDGDVVKYIYSTSKKSRIESIRVSGRDVFVDFAKWDDGTAETVAALIRPSDSKPFTVTSINIVPLEASVADTAAAPATVATAGTAAPSPPQEASCDVASDDDQSCRLYIGDLPLDAKGEDVMSTLYSALLRHNLLPTSLHGRPLCADDC